MKDFFILFVFGCPRIAQQFNLAFGTTLNKDVVRRILSAHFQSIPGNGGPSWLAFLGHTKDRLFFWSDRNLERKLAAYGHYYNNHRSHQSLNGNTALLAIDDYQARCAKLDNYSWQSHCKGLYFTPMAA